MKYVLTGGAGNVSRPLAEILLSKGHEVILISRQAEHLKPLTDKGAKAAIGSVEDVGFLKQAFAGADAVYTMVPPQFAAADLEAYRQIALNYTEAIQSNRIPYVLTLSSIGAHLPQGCGPVSGLYRVEQELNQLQGVHVRHLRPGYFYTNLLGNIGMIKHMNFIGGIYGEGMVMVLSHPDDIAGAAADELNTLSFTGHSVRYLASDERIAGDIASVLGKAVGKPDLRWVEFTDEQAYQGMVQAGLPEGMAQKYVEMGTALRTGIMWEEYRDNPPSSFGKTKLENFAESFAQAYQAG